MTDEKSNPDASRMDDIINTFAGRVSGAALSALSFMAHAAAGATTKIAASPEQLDKLASAGKSLRDIREVAGLTLQDIRSAIGNRNSELLEEAEAGRGLLSFEIILRLAALYARNDPLPFILKYARTYSPATWEMLTSLGLDRIPVHLEREREFINIYRSSDAVRQLSKEEFDQLLSFVRESFTLALNFIEQHSASVPRPGVAKSAAQRAVKQPAKPRAKAKSSARPEPKAKPTPGKKSSPTKTKP